MKKIGDRQSAFDICCKLLVWARKSSGFHKGLELAQRESLITRAISGEVAAM